MFFILTSGALAVTFVPVFNQRLATGNKKSAWELSSSILNIMAIITFITSILIIIFADPLVRYVVGPGLKEDSMALAINMMRIIAINPFLFSIATVLSSIQQAVGRFVFYAIAPAVYNIGIIIGIVWFTNGINIFGIQIFEGGIMGVALGVVLGAILQVAIGAIGLIGLGFDYDFKIFWKNHGVRSTLKLLPARSLDQGIYYVNSIVNTNLASRLGAGVIRSYQQATSLRQMPVNLIGVAISTAFFPKMTEDIASEDEDRYERTFRSALRMIVFFAAPITIIAYFSRGYIVNFIKNGGDKTIAMIFGGLALSILFGSIYHIASRGFYARQDTKTPLIVSIVSIGTNIVLAIALTRVLNIGPEGLAIAQTIATGLEVLILLSILQVKSNRRLLNRDFWSAIARMVFASVIAGCMTYSAVKFFPLMATDNSFLATFPKFFIIAAIGLGTYLIAAYFLNLSEVKPVVNKITKIIFRNVK
jgi:putative peptidoglycan lipid II flippase